MELIALTLAFYVWFFVCFSRFLLVMKLFYGTNYTNFSQGFPKVLPAPGQELT